VVFLGLIASSLWRQRGLFGLWIACLSATVSGLLVVDVFRGSLTYTLTYQGQEILTADISVSSRRSFSESEVADLKHALPAASPLTRLTEMMAMVTHGKTSRLASLRFVEDQYPLIGTLLIERNGYIVPLMGAELESSPKIWVAPDILTLMQVQAGDELKIGEISFKIDGIISKDPSQTLRFGSMAPRIFIGRKFLPQTGLLQFGSTFTDALLAKATERVKADVEKAFPDSSIQVTIPADLEQGSFRVLSRLMDFLGLIGLVTLCLGWIGVYYLGRRWLSLEASSTGVLKSLGFTVEQAQGFLIAKLLVIMLTGITGGGILAWLLAKSFLPMVQSSMPAGFVLIWSWTSSVLLLLIGPLTGLLLLLPSIRALVREPTLQMINGTATYRSSWVDILSFSLTAAILFVALTLLQARSWRVTLIFLASLVGTLIVAAAFGYLAILVSQRWQRRGWLWHLVISQWTRRRALAVLLIAVSAMSGLLSQLIPNLGSTLRHELDTPPDGDRPALFMIDIQDEQLQPLTAWLKENQVEIAQSAPFIRARILQVNGQPFERMQTGKWASREKEMDSRFRNRGVNLSYRDSLSPSESIVAGKDWNALNNTWDGAEVSVEQSYADRLSLKLGDKLLFDVQGLELEARIANLREINWDTFQPNFFMTFKSGVLNDAPKTWIMTIKRDAKHSPVAVQSLVVEKFPNVTSINVREALDSAAEIFAKLSSGLKLASSMCLALGIAVFLMILVFQLASSQVDWMQLHLLGLSQPELLSVQLLTYGGLCAIGAMLGSLMSLAVAWALTHFAFQSHLVVNWLAMGEIFALIVGLALSGMTVLAWRLGRSNSMSQLIAE